MSGRSLCFPAFRFSVVVGRVLGLVYSKQALCTEPAPLEDSRKSHALATPQHLTGGVLGWGHPDHALSLFFSETRFAV